jgi:hypothetical protein
MLFCFYSVLVLGAFYHTQNSIILLIITLYTLKTVTEDNQNTQVSVIKDMYS